jgi:uncharacterized protein YlxW (UPF0749 family)
MGISKKGKASPKSRLNPAPQRLDQLQKEQRRLRQEIKQLRAERDRYKQSLIAMMREEIPINKKELLGLVGKGPPLLDVIADLERQGA